LSGSLKRAPNLLSLLNSINIRSQQLAAKFKAHNYVISIR
jgi:hypothetical protein